MKTGLTVPTDADGLLEIMSDDKKRVAYMSDPATAAEFMDAYAKAMDKKGDIAAQISEQTTAALTEFLQRNGQVARPDMTEQKIQAKDLPSKGTGAARNAKHNPSAPGAPLDGLFSGFGEFIQTIEVRNQARAGAARNFDKLTKLHQVRNAYSSSDPASAGFLIPEEFRSEIMQIALEMSIVRSRATVISMSTQTTSLPFVDETTHVGSVFGGMVFAWTGESGSINPTEAKFGRVKLEANKLTGGATVPNELMADAPALGSWFSAAAPAGLAFFEDIAFLTGDGGMQPLGILNSPAMITVSKESNQPANTIQTENILKMYSRMLPSSLNSAVWLVNQTCIPQLLTLSIAVGTGGDPVNLVNIQATPTMTMLGRPIIVTEKVPPLSSLGDIVFADIGYYLVGDRQSISVESSEHARFMNDETAIKIIERIDGRPWVQSPITPLNGSTVSPFVQLQAR